MNDHPPQPPLGATPEPSATPRTDAQPPVEIFDANGNAYESLLVDSDFARQLETELAEMTARAVSLSLHLPPETLVGDVRRWRDEAKAQLAELTAARAALSQCEEGLAKAEETANYWEKSCERERAQRQMAVGAQEYRGNTVSYMYDKAKCYGDMVHGCVPALAAAGFPVDEDPKDGRVGAIARAIAKMAEARARAEADLAGEREHVRGYVAALDRKTWQEFHDKGTTDAGWRCLVYNCISLLTAAHAKALEDGKIQSWQPIAEMKRDEMQFILVTDGDVVRLRLWNPSQTRWEPEPPRMGPLTIDDDCQEPTHFMPIPDFASAPATTGSGKDGASP